MSAADSLVTQALEWFALGNEQREVRILLDLPDVSWLIVHEIERSDDVLRLTARSARDFYLSGETFEIACGVSDVKAVRWEETWAAVRERKSDDIFA